MNETILCAATWYKDLITPEFNPTNVDRGIVFSGYRHIHCLHQMVSMTGKRNSEIGEYIEGFLTNRNRFVDRIEAGLIAIKCGQIDKLNYSTNKLYSEDLY
jgi:hypothetical protein